MARSRVEVGREEGHARGPAVADLAPSLPEAGAGGRGHDGERGPRRALPAPRQGAEAELRPRHRREPRSNSAHC